MTLQDKTPIDMFGPWMTSLEEELVMDVMRSGWYGKDAYTYCEKFEKEFAAYHNRKYALMTPNCTSAIHLLLAGLGIEEGDEVILPESTWIASAAPVTYQKATTVFADVDPITWCLSPQTIERVITPRTKAVIVVDLYGNMPDWDALLALGEKHKIHIIEDSAESLGSTFKGRRAGSFGIGSVFSFHRTKTIATGEGGVLLLDDDALYERCALLRDHGRAPGAYYNTEIGFKYMPSNLQAALAYGQFQRLDELVEKKRWILNSYKENLKHIPDLVFNLENEDVYNGAWASIAILGKSHGLNFKTVQERLAAKNIPVREFFFPLSSLPAYPDHKDYGLKNNKVAYDLAEQGLIFPSAYNLVDEQITRVSEAFSEILGG